MGVNSYEAEASVLGCLMLSAEELAGAIFERVQPEAFGASQLRTLYRAARELWLEKKPVDPVTVLSRAGSEYADTVRAAMELTPTAAHWQAYCDAVSDAAQLRELQAVAAEILEAADAEEARGALRKAQGMLAPRRRKDTWTWQEMINGFMDRLDSKEAEWLDWSIPALNDRLMIREGKFVILAAESSVGKTAFALQVAFHMARQGKRVGFFSLETPEPDATDRVFAQQARLQLSDIKKRTLKEAEIRSATDLAQATYEADFSLVEAAGWDVQQIRAKTLAEGYQIVFIDYVQLVQAEGREPSDQVRAISMGLHTMCQQLGVTVIGLSQVTPPPKNQEGKRRELSKENLRESRQLIHDADAILILDLIDIKVPMGDRVLKVDKNKDGPRVRMQLSFDAPRLLFEYVPGSTDRKIAVRTTTQAEAKEAAEKTGPFSEMKDDGDLPF